MNAEQVDQYEIEVLLDAIFQRYGYDFQQYAQPSLRRRVSGFLKSKNFSTPNELLPAILHNSEMFWEFVTHLSVPHTGFFRDPDFFKVLRTQVIPYLQSLPFLRVWVAGCASGEEAYSMAVLLHEEGLLERTRMYGTDVNPAVLLQAEHGKYSLHHIKNAATKYEQSGGTQSWLDYFTVKGKTGVVRQDLKQILDFSTHNLIGQEMIGAMHLVLCRNVLIYFTSDLQNHVLTRLMKSLWKRGFLCLSPKESLESSPLSQYFDRLSSQCRIYRLRSSYHISSSE